MNRVFLIFKFLNMNVIKVKTSDNAIYGIPSSFFLNTCEEVVPITLKNMIQDMDPDDSFIIPLSNINDKNMIKIFQYMEHYNNNTFDNKLEGWNKKFLNISVPDLYELIIASDYLNIKGLYNLLLIKLSNILIDKIKSPTSEELIEMEKNAEWIIQ